MKPEFKFSIGELEQLITTLKTNVNHRSACSAIYISVIELPDGSHEIQFEQPCCYSECTSSYYRYHENK